MCPSNKLIQAFKDYEVTTKHLYAKQMDCIRLKDTKKKFKEYEDSSATRSMRAKLHNYNNLLNRTNIKLTRNKKVSNYLEIKPTNFNNKEYYRVFNDGSFELGGSNSDSEFDSEDNLDFISKVMDNVLINIVDLFLDIGTILNDVPSAVVDVISGGVDGASGLDGRTIHLLLTDNWLVTRSDMPLTSLLVQIGSSDHPVGQGDHLLLSKDRGLGLVQGRNGPVEPLTPVAASLRFSGLSACLLYTSDAADE